MFGASGADGQCCHQTHGPQVIDERVIFPTCLAHIRLHASGLTCLSAGAEMRRSTLTRRAEVQFCAALRIKSVSPFRRKKVCPLPLALFIRVSKS